MRRVCFVLVALLGLMLGAEGARADTFVIPAYCMDGGNGHPDAGQDGWGVPDPVVVNGGISPNTAEYAIDFPVTADYTISVRYCAAAVRPVNVFLDDGHVAVACRGTTGTWQSGSAKWEEAAGLGDRAAEPARVRIAQGRHRLRLQQAPEAGCFPHLAALRFDCAESFPDGAQPHWAAGALAGNARTSLVVPSYAYRRGNVKFDRGFICNALQRPNIVEYEIDFPVAARYVLFADYAAAEPRPVQLYLDDQPRGEICAGVTGSWEAGSARWERQRELDLPQGKHTITLIASQPVLPHLVALRFDSPQPFPEGYVFTPTPPPRESLPAGDRLIEDLAALGAGSDLKCSVFRGEQGGSFVHLTFTRSGRLTHAVVPLPRDAVRVVIERGQALAQRLGKLPNAPSFEKERETFAALARDLDALPAGESQALFELYLRALRAKHDLALRNPLLSFGGLLFTRRYTFTSSHIYTDHFDGSTRFGGNLCVLSPLRPDGQVREIVTGLAGGIPAFPELSLDARRVVFSYKKDAATPYHLYEVNVDGTGLRQLTDGPYDDMDPCYLPNGEIMFTSTRCGFVVLCHNAFTVATLYLMDRDGGNIRPLSANTSTEFMPSLMPDGRVLYTRWEYVDKGAGNLQSLWETHPDGTFSEHVFGNHTTVTVTLADARAIPGTSKVVAISAPHMPLSVGPVCIIDPAIDMESPAGCTNITPEIGHPPHYGYPNPDKGFYKTPYPLSDEYFLVSYHHGPDWADATGYAIYLLDVYGNRDLVYRDEEFSAFDPIPLRPQPTPPVVATGTTGRPFEQPTEARADENAPGEAIVMDCNEGLDGIPRGTVKYIRVMEDMPKPHGCEQCYGYGLQNPAVSRQGHFAVKRVHGLVKLSPDGSAHFRVPSGKNIYFQALDENLMEIQRMRSFVTYMPGEVRSCIGCHEHRRLAPGPRDPMAAHQPAVDPTPPPGGVRTVSFIRDAQPVLDKYCVRCHSGPTPAGKLDFSADRTRLFNMAYETIMSRQLVKNVDVDPRDAYIKPTPPKFFGSFASRLTQVIVGGHHDVKVEPADFQSLCLWVDANAPYYGTYEYERPHRTGGRDLLVPGTEPWPIFERRCATCHNSTRAPALERELLLNFTHPDESRFLLAPLAKDAGGWGLCREPVFRDQKDPDYQTVLSGLRKCHEEVAANPRVDMR